MKHWVMNAGGGFGLWCGPYIVRHRTDGTSFVMVQGKRFSVSLKPLEGEVDPNDRTYFGYAPGEAAWHFDKA